MAMPPSSPSVSFSECFQTSATRRSTRTASRVTSVPMPSPGRTRIDRFMRSVRGHLLRLHLLHFLDQRDDLFVEQTFFAIGQRCEPLVQHVELLFIQLE